MIPGKKKLDRKYNIDLKDQLRTKLRNELILEFGNPDSETHETYDKIQLSYSKYIEYFKIQSGNEIVLKSLHKAENISSLKIGNRTLDAFFGVNPKKNQQKKEHKENQDNPQKDSPTNTNPQPKTLNYLCVSLGYYGWIAFTENKKRVNLENPNADVSDSVVETDTLTIPGTICIDKEFVKNFRGKKKYSLANFYTAKYEKNCQWWGTVNGFAIKRQEHTKCVEIIKKAFENQKSRKVEMLIVGMGGSGKSTFLRMLALEHYGKSVTVLWLERLDEFIRNGLASIQQNGTKKFLVFIEDWSRMSRTCSSDKISAFFEATNTIDNIRIVIADRTEQKVYAEHLNNRNQKITITSEENQSILTSIIEKNPDWKPAFERLFSKKENFKISLFLLLFLLSRIAENKNYPVKDDFEPEAEFISIIESDLSALCALGRTGIAKALFYWANIYAQYQLKISYRTFLAIADYYGKDENPLTHLEHWKNSNDPVFHYLKNYISISDTPHDAFVDHLKESFVLEKNRGDQYIFFNHDVLCETGLTKVTMEWKPFTSTEFKEILSVVRKVNEHYTMYQFSSLLFLAPSVFVNDGERKNFIDFLVQSKNEIYLYRSFVHDLERLNVSSEKLNDYAGILWEKEVYPPEFLRYYFSQCGNLRKYELIDHVLFDDEKRIFIKGEVPSIMINNASVETALIVSTEVLEDSRWEKYSDEFIIAVLNVNYKKEFSKSKKYLLSIAYLIARNRFCRALIHRSDWLMVNKKIMHIALLKVNENERKKFYENYFTIQNIHHFSNDMISVALKVTKDIFISRYCLEYPQNFDTDVILAALSNYSGRKELPHAVINTIDRIIFEEIRIMPVRIKKFRHISRPRGGFSTTKNFLFAGLMRLRFFQNPKWSNTIYLILSYGRYHKGGINLINIGTNTYSNSGIHDPAPKIHHELINEFGNPQSFPNHQSNRGDSPRLPELEQLKKHRKQLYSNYIADVLWSCIDQPKILESHCLKILKNWKTIGIREISYRKKNRIYDASNLLFALCHPKLRQESLKAAKEFSERKRLMAFNEKNIHIACSSIVQYQKYPKWNFEKQTVELSQ